MTEFENGPDRLIGQLPPGYSAISGRSVGGETDWDGPGITEYLQALRRRIWLVVATALVGLGLAWYAIAHSEIMLASKTVVQLADERAAPTGGLAGLAASLGSGGGSQRSQVQVIRSRLILGQVVDSLGLRVQRKVEGVIRDNFRPTSIISQASVAEGATASTLELHFDSASVSVKGSGPAVKVAYGEPVQVDGVSFVVPTRPEREELVLYILPREKAIDTVLQSVNVFPREGTNIIDVIVTGYDPAITREIADATAEIYQNFSSSNARIEAERRRRFVMEQLKTTEDLLHETQDRLTEFRKREGLYSSKALAVAEQAGRADIDIRVADLQADRRVYQSLIGELRRPGASNTGDVLRSIASSQSVVENPVIDGLYNQLSRYQVLRDSLVVGPRRSSATNPDVVRLDSLISITENRLVAATRNHVESLDARIAALGMVQARADSALSHLASAEPEEVRLMLQMESIGEAAKELRERFYTAGMAEAATVDQVVILDRALPGELAGSPPSRSLVLGLIFGLMVGGAGAIALESADRSIRRREEMERHLRLAPLAVIPPITRPAKRRLSLTRPVRAALPARSRGGRSSMEMVTANHVHSPAAEAYRTLRTNLVFSPLAASLRSILVTSATKDEGKTTVASNLAITFAQQGRRVLLLDCDLRGPRLHGIFEVPREPGLSDVLSGEAELETSVKQTSVPNLSVIPAGGFPRLSATDLFAGGALRSLLTTLAQDFDMVVVDAPPVLATANASILGTQVDGVLLVVRAGQTARDVVRLALQQLSGVGANVVGAVLNDPDAETPRLNEYSSDRNAEALS